ncbi:MAG: NAD(P)/FAD-dependent oxidoreductase [Planctomycetota bacterium]
MPDLDVIVVGGGPAGLVAAERAASRGLRTLLFEKNRRPGAKILIAGGGRCNLTHACDAEGVVEAFGTQGPFLHSALASLSPGDVVELFRREGVPTYVEEGGKVFPKSDQAEDVLAALLCRLQRSGAALATEESLWQIDRQPDGFRLTTSKRRLTAASVVLCCGGKSYPGCGTTGDGYAWASALGHTIVNPRPALAPLTCALGWVRALTGIAIPDAAVELQPERSLRLKPADRRRLRHRGALLFAHFGLSGPTAMNVSRFVSDEGEDRRWSLVCDLLPQVPRDELDRALWSDAAAAGSRQVANLLALWLPGRLAQSLADAHVELGACRASELSRDGRRALVDAVKALRLPIDGTLGFKKAEVTAGGVSLAEVDSRTLQSKLVPGLYFAGEMLDLDGPIGGYNIQAALSTGWLAGTRIDSARPAKE